MPPTLPNIPPLTPNTLDSVPQVKPKHVWPIILIVLIGLAALIYIFKSAPTPSESPGLTQLTPEQVLVELQALSASRTTPTPTTAQQEKALQDLSKVSAGQTTLTEAERLQALKDLSKE